MEFTDTNISESVLVDFETKMEKERAHSEAHLAEIQDAFTNEIIRVEMKFMTAALEESEK